MGEATATTIDERPLERRPIFWFYGSASVAYGIKDTAFSYLLLIFSNQVLGIPGYLASLALAIAKDIEELIVVIDGNHTPHEYNWIPAFKDRRLRRFDGLIENGSIRANYEFEQEGQSETVTISISLEKEQAIVTRESARLGFGSTLARVDC